MRQGKFAIFTVTTPRSGTQWLHSALCKLYGDHLDAEHEPVEMDYNPRAHFRSPTASSDLRCVESVSRHISSVREVLNHRSYAEVGYPCCCAIPLFAEEFPSRVKIIQLIRHPFRVAASLLTHKWYTPGSGRSDIDGLMALLPSDPGARFPEFRSKWPGMTSFEKALYYWLEVHHYGLEIERTSGLPFLRVRFEDLLTSRHEQERLAGFLGVPETGDWNTLVPQMVDRYHGKTRTEIDTTLIHRHEAILSLAEKFGYDVGSESGDSLRRRYYMSPAGASARIIKKKIFRMVFGREYLFTGRTPQGARD